MDFQERMEKMGLPVLLVLGIPVWTVAVSIWYNSNCHFFVYFRVSWCQLGSRRSQMVKGQNEQMYGQRGQEAGFSPVFRGSDNSFTR